jgi:hypothetical protein
MTTVVSSKEAQEICDHTQWWWEELGRQIDLALLTPAQTRDLVLDIISR